MFGGGGNPCTICEKTVYPAETITFEKKPYHVECFRCCDCNKKMEGAGKAAGFESKLYCQGCFKKGGFAQKQRNVKWEKKEGGSTTSSKFGGGGNPCEICAKTVYPAETISFEKKVYHQECFKCSHCSKKVTPSGASQFESTIYCNKCFGELGLRNKQAKSTGSKGASSAVSAKFSKFGGGGSKCTICDKTVYPAETVQYEKKPYHQNCFKCSKCAKKMTPAGAAQFEDELFCTKCFKDGGYNRKQTAHKGGSAGGAVSAKFSKFGGGGNKCAKCDKTVYPAETVSYEKKAYHSDCFTCDECNKKLTPTAAEYHKADGSIHCKKCFMAKNLHLA